MLSEWLVGSTIGPPWKYPIVGTPTWAPSATFIARPSPRRESAMMPSLEFGSWQALPDGAGDALAAAGSLSASASGTRVVVWDRDRVISSVAITGSPAGVPRFVAGTLHFGPGWVESGRWTVLPPPPPTVYGGVRSSAWSRDGHRVALVVDGPWTPANGGSSPLLVERRTDGSERVITSDCGVAAVWMSDRAIVGIGRDLRVWNTAGDYVVGPAHEGGVAAVSGTRDETWLFTVGTDGTALLWNTETFAPPVVWPGVWVGGAISPDGRWIIGIDVGGELHTAWRDAGALVPAGPVPALGRARAVVLDDLRLVASFDEAPFHRTAEITVTP